MTDYSWTGHITSSLNFLEKYEQLLFIALFLVFLLIFHVIFIYPKLRPKIIFKIIDYIWLLLAAAGIMLAFTNKDILSLSNNIDREQASIVYKLDVVMNRLESDRNMFCSWRENIFKGADFPQAKIDTFCRYLEHTDNLFKTIDEKLSFNSYLVDDARWIESVYDDGALQKIVLNPTPVEYIALYARLYYERQKVQLREMLRVSRKQAERMFPDKYLFLSSVLWVCVLPLAIALRITKTTGDILHDRR